MLAITTLPLCRHATLGGGAVRVDTKNDHVAEEWVLSCQIVHAVVQTDTVGPEVRGRL